ncbi:MAG: hypothetical protein ABI889_04985 [Gemmatimonadota bacterium]
MRLPRRMFVLLSSSLFAGGLLHCYHSQSVDVATIARDSLTGRDIISEVTLIDGREIHYDKGTRPTLRGDTLRGQVHDAMLYVPIDSVQRVWIRKLDPVRTTLATVGILVAVAGVVSAIAIASKQSCPFIYSWDGQRYVFDAEPYGGAITRGLERDDYGELHSLVADHGVYRLLVTNEVNETQYTNRLRLLIVDHAPGLTIRADEFGRFYGFDSLVALSSAYDANGRDLRPWLVATDALIWEPVVPPEGSAGVREDITMSFAKPKTASQGFLLTRISTGLWGSQMIRQFSQLRGTALNDWYAMIDSSSSRAAALRSWNIREELYALKIEVEEPSGWNVRGILPGGGPFLATDRVVSLDLSHVRGDSVRIRIRPPYGFWALNSFAIAYGSFPQLHVTAVDVATARTSDGRDVRSELTATDERYYAMPTTADHAFVTFAAPALAPGITRTIFAHARGYYRLHLNPATPPDSATLAEFMTVPDAAARFAYTRYTQSHPRIALAH